MTRALIAAICLVTAAPAFAEGDGDAIKGEKDFKRCKACHSITADDGTDIVKGGKTGPNLYGVIGRAVAGSDFNYGDSIIAAGATGLIWDEVNMAAYLIDPGAWLTEATGDAAAKSKMTFKMAKGGEDIAAYLASVVPAQ